MECLDTSKYTIYSDLPGQEAAGGGTIPPELCITALKPDIVVIDTQKKELMIYELTCPLEKEYRREAPFQTEQICSFHTGYYNT